MLEITQGSIEQGFWCELTVLFKSSLPIQMVWQVFGCRAVKALQSLFKPTMLSINILYMTSATNPLTSTKIDGFMTDAFCHAKGLAGRIKLADSVFAVPPNTPENYTTLVMPPFEI